MSSQNFSYDDFLRHQTISREQFARLQAYIELLKKWQKTINLVSQSTLADVWNRHIIDSAQLIDHITNHGTADLGSGAGFPGLVLAILGIKKMTLVESDARKVAFLREAARVTETDITVLNQRVESVSLRDFSTLTARAFAPLASLLPMVEATLTPTHTLLLLKGKNYREELDEARKHWSFDCQVHKSATDSDGTILSLTRISKQGAPIHG